MTEKFYEQLWKCAGLTPSQGEEARRELAALHENDESRELSEQRSFTEWWLELTRLLWANRRRRVEWPFEPVFTSRLDGLVETTSYRLYTLHQTSLLARAFLHAEARARRGRTSLLWSDEPNPSTDDLSRVVRALHGAKLMEQGFAPPKWDATSGLHAQKVVWLRDERFASVRLLGYWLAGVAKMQNGRQAQAALDRWAAGLVVYDKFTKESEVVRARLQLPREVEETELDHRLRRSILVNAQLARAQAQPPTEEGRRVARLLRWHVAEKYHYAVAEPPELERRRHKQRVREEGEEEEEDDDDDEEEEKMTAKERVEKDRKKKEREEKARQEREIEAHIAVEEAVPMPREMPELRLLFLTGEYDGEAAKAQREKAGKQLLILQNDL